VDRWSGYRIASAPINMSGVARNVAVGSMVDTGRVAAAVGETVLQATKSAMSAKSAHRERGFLSHTPFSL